MHYFWLLVLEGSVPLGEKSSGVSASDALMVCLTVFIGAISKIERKHGCAFSAIRKTMIIQGESYNQLFLHSAERSAFSVQCLYDTVALMYEFGIVLL